MSESKKYDAVVIGAGFYGVSIALFLVKQRDFKKVLVVEQTGEICSQASYKNQARLHNGYHYPRSYTTAYRSRINFPRFVTEFHQAIKSDFIKLYAIARKNSKVTSNQFVRFCTEIGAPIEAAPAGLAKLFEPRLIEDVFLVEEYAFDAAKIATLSRFELDKSGVEVRTRTKVTDISKADSMGLSVSMRAEIDGNQRVQSRYVFNCSYAGLNHFQGEFPLVRAAFKHEITEMALLELPEALKGIGVTVMDGPFFSCMPFPARDLHSLSHVRYTPHTSWMSQKEVNPYEKLQNYHQHTRVDRMLRDSARYLPALNGAKYVESLFEVKTVLMKNEVDDGRPILFEKSSELPGCYSILGGKIDNIYDVLEKIYAELILNS